MGPGLAQRQGCCETDRESGAYYIHCEYGGKLTGIAVLLMLNLNVIHSQEQIFFSQTSRPKKVYLNSA